MKHTVLPSVNLFFVNDDKVLLGRRVNTGYMDDHLCPPGGHVEEGETPTVAAIREAQEELGIDLKPDDLEFICVAARKSPVEYVAYEFMIKNKDYAVINNEPDKCSELVWSDIHNLPSDVIPQFADIITRSIVGDEKYLELGY